MANKKITKTVVYKSGDNIPHDVFENEFFKSNGIDSLEDIGEFVHKAIKSAQNVNSSVKITTNGKTTYSINGEQVDEDTFKDITNSSMPIFFKDTNIRKKCTYCGSEFNGNVTECDACGSRSFEKLD